MPKIGEPAVDFHLTDIQGGQKSLGDFHGHWLFLVFHRHLA